MSFLKNVPKSSNTRKRKSKTLRLKYLWRNTNKLSFECAIESLNKAWNHRWTKYFWMIFGCLRYFARECIFFNFPDFINLRQEASFCTMSTGEPCPANIFMKLAPLMATYQMIGSFTKLKCNFDKPRMSAINFSGKLAIR